MPYFSKKNNADYNILVKALSGNQQKIGFLAGIPAKIVNTIKVLTICTFVGTMLFGLSNKVLADCVTTTETKTVVSCIGDDGICTITTTDGVEAKSPGRATVTTVTTTTTTCDYIIVGPPGDTIIKPVDSTNVMHYAQVNGVFLSYVTVKNLPKTNVFFPDSIDIYTGIGWIDAHYFDDSNGYHFIRTNEIVISNYYDWLIQSGIVSNEKAIVYPNPTSSNTSIKLVEDYVTKMDNIQQIVYFLYDANQTLITTLISTDPLEDVEISANYITAAGTYFIVCNVKYLNTIGQLATDEFALQFVKTSQQGGEGGNQ